MKQLSHRPGERHRVRIGDAGVSVGDGQFLVIGGPCAVESRDGLLRIAAGIADAGASMLRGGAWKPRTSPHSRYASARLSKDCISHERHPG